MFPVKKQGFTALEALIAVAILGILSAVTIPHLKQFIENSRLKSASEHLYSDIKLAHSEAIKNQSDMYISFQTGASWCYGMSDTGACDCSTANDCTVSGNETVVSSDQFTSVSLAIGGLNASGGISYFTLDSTRGTVDITGTATFSTSGKSITVNVNKMGNPNICSPDINGYSAC